MEEIETQKVYVAQYNFSNYQYHKETKYAFTAEDRDTIRLNFDWEEFKGFVRGFYHGFRHNQIKIVNRMHASLFPTGFKFKPLPNKKLEELLKSDWIIGYMNKYLSKEEE